MPIQMPAYFETTKSSHSLSVGIIGLPNIGKTSLFNLLSNQNLPCLNYPFCTIDPAEGILPIIDPKFNNLCQIFNPKIKKPNFLKIFDIAGLIRNAHEGKGLGNAFLSHISRVEALFHVIRCFNNEDVVHCENSIDPVRDLQIVEDELRFKDLEMVKKRLEKVVKDFRAKIKLSDIIDVKSKIYGSDGLEISHENENQESSIDGEKEASIMSELSLRAKNTEESGNLDSNQEKQGKSRILHDSPEYNDLNNIAHLDHVLRTLNDKNAENELRVLVKLFRILCVRWPRPIDFTEAERIVVSNLRLLTTKRVVYLANINEDEFISKKANKNLRALMKYINELNARNESFEETAQSSEPVVAAKSNSAMPSNIIVFSVSHEQNIKSDEYSPFVQKLVAVGYSMLNLITFYTCSKEEVHAWSLKNNTNIQQAGSVIHTDFEKYFVMAEVYNYDDLILYKTENEVKKKGKCVSRGKTYIVKDGDIVHYKINPPKNKAKK